MLSFVDQHRCSWCVVTFALGDLHLTGAACSRPLYYLELMVLVLGLSLLLSVALRLLPGPRAYLGDPVARALLRVGGGVSLRHHPKKSEELAAHRRLEPRRADHHGPAARRWSTPDPVNPSMAALIGPLVVVPIARAPLSCSSSGSWSSTSSRRSSRSRCELCRRGLPPPQAVSLATRQEHHAEVSRHTLAQLVAISRPRRAA